MKQLFLAATTALCLSQHAQSQDTKTVKVNADKDYTRTGMIFNLGDTAFLSASGDITLHWKVTLAAGRTGPCGYTRPQKITLDQFNRFTAVYNRKDTRNTMLPHPGALVAYSFLNNQMTDAKEYGMLQNDPKNINRKIMTFSANNVELVFGPNDTETKNNGGSFSVTVTKKKKLN